MAADVQKFLDEWRSAVADDDQDRITSLLADEMTFHSPVIFKPSSDRTYIDQVLSFVAESLGDFKYVDAYEQPNGAALLFTGKVGDLSIDGIDLFKLNSDGKVCELKVMLRPLNAVMILATTMKERFAAMGTAP